MDKEKIKYFAYTVVALFGAALGAYIFIKYLFVAVLPFFIGWTVAFSVRPPAAKISETTKIPRRVVAVSLGTLTVLTIIAVVCGILIFALGEAWSLIRTLNEDNKILDLLVDLLDTIGRLFGGADFADRLGDALVGAVGSALSGAVSLIGGLASAVPRVLIFIVMTAIATVYFCLDLERVNGAVIGILPERIATALTDFKNRFLIALLRYIRAYLFLMLLTFVAVAVGLMLMRIPFSLLIALVVAVLDLLPLVGVGTILVPWGIAELALGSVGRGTGLLILFVLTFVARQFLEPRIVGKNLGIHPLVSLLLLYLCYTFFGLLGLFIVPVITVLVKCVAAQINITRPPSDSSASESET